MMEVNDNTTLRNLQQMVDEWIKTYGVRYFNELTNMACLTEEVGELARIIARQYGEQSFRDMEFEACKELAQMNNLIIASGGGAFTFERNVNVFKGIDKIVLLDVPLEAIKFRLRNDTKRPLLQRPDKDKAMEELYNKRLPLYKSAADIVISGKGTPKKTAEAIVEAVRQK